MRTEAPVTLARLCAALALAVAAAGAPAPGRAEPGPNEEESAAGGLVRGTVPVGKSAEPVVVYLKDVPGDYSPRVRVFELRAGQAGRVLPVAVGDTVKFVNRDGPAHTVASADNGGVDLGLLDKGDERGTLLLRPGAYAFRCAIHKELLGHVFVAPTPHATLADKGGAYELRDVPPGRFAVGAWSPSTRLADGVAVVAGEGGAVDVAPPVAATRAAAPAARPAPRPAAKEKPRAELGVIRGKVEAEPAKYLSETIVYLKKVPGTFSQKVHVMDQRKMKFIPHLLTVTQGDTVRFLNNDGLAHNVYSNDGEAYNLGMFQDGEERPYTFMHGGVYSQLCNIHPDMLAYVFVGQNPFAAIVDKSGRYELRNVPPGEYTLAVWNSHLRGSEKTVAVDLNKTVEANFTVAR
jgi:plastocyanin